MGVIINKENDNDEISRRISADLKSRQEAAAKAESPDLAEDSDYVKNMQKTGRFGWIWVVLIVLAIISMIIIVTI